MTKVAPGSIIGIIGGGQLGRMTALAAANLGYRTNIFSLGENDPAKHVSTFSTNANYQDEEKLVEFAKSVDVVSFEFENIPYDTLKHIDDAALVRPNPNCLHIAQNRIREKNFLNSIGIKTAPFKTIENESDIDGAMAEIGTSKAILKTSELGYDGKGQAKVSSDDEIKHSWSNVPSVLEGFVDFDIEISVIVARKEGGEKVCFPIGQNIHENGILATSIVPANISKETADQACDFAKKAADELELVGLLAVEFFVLKDGSVLANEIAPRPHNSGHWTMDGCVTSQFEQYVRAICDLPFGSVEMTCEKITMQNLIGDQVSEWEEHIDQPNRKIHIYGKTEIRPARKMGHLNIIELAS